MSKEGESKQATERFSQRHHFAHASDEPFYCRLVLNAASRYRSRAAVGGVSKCRGGEQADFPRFLSSDAVSKVFLLPLATTCCYYRLTAD